MPKGVEKIGLVNPDDRNIVSLVAVEGKAKKYPPLVTIQGGVKVEFEAEYYKDTPESSKGRAKWIVKPISELPFSKNNKQDYNGDRVGISIPKKFCGPASHQALEAFKNKPESKYPTMVLLLGKAPYKIISSAWSKAKRGNSLGKSPIKYGDNIWLNVKTEGLNGATLDVKIYLRKGGGRSDTWVRTYTGVKCNKGEINLNIKSTYAWKKETGLWTSSKEEFYIKIKLKGKKDYLVDEKGQTPHARYLRIENKISKKTIENSSNSLPVKTSKDEADVERYEPCRFNSITIVDEGNPIPLFDEGKLKLTGNKKKTEFQMSETIHFDLDKSYIRGKDKPALNRIVTFLKDSPYVPVELGTHCDIRASHAYNDTLSLERAVAVVNYLKTKGVTNKISSKGYGKRKLLIKGAKEELTEAQHEQNRRATIRLRVFENNAESIIFNTIAPDKTDKKEIQVQVVDYKTDKCFKKGTEHEHDDKIKVIELTQDGKKEPYEYNGKTMIYSKTPKAITIWPTKAEPNLFKYYINSCRYYFDKKTPSLIVNVFPDIEWEIAFILTVGNSYSGTLKYKREKLNGYHKKFGFNYLKSDLALSAKKTGNLAFAISGKYIVNDKEQESSLALKKISSSIEKATLAYNTVSEHLEIFNHKKGKGKSAAVSKGVLSLEFNIDPPNIALALGWKYGHGKNNKELIPLYKGGLKLDPLIGISIGVDLVPLIQFVPGAGKVIDWILDVVQYLTSSKIYIIFECFAAVKAELSLSYNKVDSFDKKGEQKAEFEAGISLKAGANSNDTVFVATTTRGGITDTVEVEKWKVEGKVATSFSFIEEVKYDRGNGKQYRQSSVAFNGAKLTITIYELISKKKLDYDAGYTNTFQILDKNDDIYKSEKSYLDGK